VLVTFQSVPAVGGWLKRCRGRFFVATAVINRPIHLGAFWRFVDTKPVETMESVEEAERTLKRAPFFPFF
jgi:hypothetical protein